MTLTTSPMISIALNAKGGHRSAMSNPRILSPCRRQVVMKMEAPDDLIPSDHPARIFAHIVERLDMSKLTAHVKSVEHAGGRPALCPAMLLTLWLYAISRGIGSAREIERLTVSDDAFKWIVGDLEVGRFALSEFRTSHGEALLALLADVLAILMHKGLLSLDVVALDGTRVRASASAPSFRRWESIEECREQAALHLKAVLADADNADVSRTRQAAREAAARDMQRRADEALLAVAALQDARRDGEARASTTDVDARVMKMPDGGFRPAYNVQFAVAGNALGGPRTIIGVDVTNVGSDMGAISKQIDEIEANTGSVPEVILADGNHVKHECLDYAHSRGVVIIAPPHKRAKARENDSDAVKEWRERMRTDSAKQQYRGRAALAELANAHVKSHYGLERVLVRGAGKVMCTALLVALTFNIVQNAAGLLS
jgi:transposase